MKKSESNSIETIQSAIEERLLTAKKNLFQADECISVEGLNDWNINKLLAIEATEDFIEIGYKLLLGRSVDPIGLRSWSKKLQAENFDRIDFLKCLRDSDEGKKHNSCIRGLALKITLSKFKIWLDKLPLISRIFGWIVQFFTIRTSIKNIEQHIGQLSQKLEVSEKRTWDALEYVYARQYAQTVCRPIHDPQALNENDFLPESYLWEFFIRHAAKFRGSEQDVATLCEAYRPILEELLKDEQLPKSLLDIGCGRGEILHFVNKLGFEGTGLDTNKAAVKYCTDKGLSAYQEDALLFLQKQNEGAFGAVTSIHVVEHLDFIYLMKLLKEVYRVLAVGGCLLLETPNPDNLVVSATQFYLDPTHKQPVPLALLQLILEFSGFKVSPVDLSVRNPVPTGKRSDDPQLDYMLTCPQDYALVGFKI